MDVIIIPALQSHVRRFLRRTNVSVHVRLNAT